MLVCVSGGGGGILLPVVYLYDCCFFLIFHKTVTVCMWKILAYKSPFLCSVKNAVKFRVILNKVHFFLSRNIDNKNLLVF